MKPYNMRLAVVTASLLPLSDTVREGCIQSWMDHAAYYLPTYVIEGQYGVVPAFAQGVAQAFAEEAEAVICLHDDVRINQQDWDVLVQDVLNTGVRFAGFGGAPLLGSADLYQTPYDPMQLARGGFMSNLQDAEAHGQRMTLPRSCVVFDGFCQIGTKDWFQSAWAFLAASGIKHHWYDGALGCLAARAKVQPGRLIPIRAHHYGGRTAVGSQEYQEWARTQEPDGDQGFWLQSHRWGYEEFKDVLPLRVEDFR